MHLWPSMSIRDSFKMAYLNKVEWNFHRMNIEKQKSPRNQQKLLDKEPKNIDVAVSETPTSSNASLGASVICKEILMLLYCCFCCGGNLISLSLSLSPLVLFETYKICSFVNGFELFFKFELGVFLVFNLNGCCRIG
ncbi:hypothetical protein CFOL_v3_34915 [Cephalotus follicularis]|uniref:Uncharacterized protein n=1 Tax=Cephalotus follicularis TaxID=3775 RepID=A0A1Q3DGE2_CEPFO|nr:hypothetical protein CFOL_v3_34915 [Cephalotus follicularis]